MNTVFIRKLDLHSLAKWRKTWWEDLERAQKVIGAYVIFCQNANEILDPELKKLAKHAQSLLDNIYEVDKRFMEEYGENWERVLECWMNEE